MTAPYTARWHEPTALGPIPSELDEKLQDAIADLVGADKVVVTAFTSDDDGTGNPTWFPDGGAGATPENGAICASGGACYFECPGRPNARLTQVLVKYNNQNSPTAPTIRLHKLDHEFDAATTAPSEDSELDSDATATASGWQIVTLDAGPDDLTEEMTYRVSISGSVGDYVAACRFEFERMKTVSNP